MKKILVLIVIVVVVGGLWYWGSTRRSLLEEEGTLARVKWGDIKVPISASGEARERQRVEIKAEASGTIIDIPVEEGDIVQPNQLLMKIDEEEEARNVDKAQAAVDQASESLAIAQIANEQAIEDETFNVELAQAAYNLAKARFEFAEFEYDRVKGLEADDHSSQTELQRKKTESLTAKADLARYDVELRRAKDAGPRNVRRTAREIELAKARQRNAEHMLHDAERRLRKTKVLNNYPSACRVVRIFVSEGQVISSAISVVGAGTPVMELADISVMEVEAQVDESDVDQVVRMMTEGHKQRDAGTPSTATSDAESLRYRDEVFVRFDALPREVFRGQIIDIAQKPRILAQIVTYDVRVRLYDNPGLESVRLGMQGTVEFAPVSEEGLCVPYECIHRKERDRYVVKMPDPDDPLGAELERDVVVGLTDGRKVVIQSGLEEDEEVYVKPPTRIRQTD
ncbi:MAG TPA: biotin/lipoyl-binding protein [Phycisphaerae bacterium]|nr:biotin/lipoyl-binding protein [Phycisphaerae bacterium]